MPLNGVRISHSCSNPPTCVSLKCRFGRYPPVASALSADLHESIAFPLRRAVTATRHQKLHWDIKDTDHHDARRLPFSCHDAVDFCPIREVIIATIQSRHASPALPATPVQGRTPVHRLTRLIVTILLVALPHMAA